MGLRIIQLTMRGRHRDRDNKRPLAVVPGRPEDRLGRGSLAGVEQERP